ncbi:hypothetical protein KKF82_07145 [Patescibacteria group bacterium]|nr:hypothetical protein [Patescibacteria group bacterium]
MEETHVGLLGQITYVKQTIAIKKQLGKDASFEEGLIEEWRRYLPNGDKHHLWESHSYAARHSKKGRPTALNGK